MKITNTLSQLADIIDRQSKVRLPLAILFAGVLAGLETVGISLILPMMTVATETTVGEASRIEALLFSISDDFKTLALYVIGLLLIKNVLGIAIVRWMTKYSLTIKSRLAEGLMHRYLAAPVPWHSARNSAEVIRNFDAAANVVGGLIMPCINMLPDIILVLLLSLVLLETNPVGSSVAGGLLVFVAFANHLLTRKMTERAGNQTLNTYSKIIQRICEGLGAIREINLMNRSGYFLDLFRRSYRGQVSAQLTANLLIQLPRYILEIALLLAALGFFMFALQDSNPKEFLPVFALFGLAAVRLLPAANRIVSTIQGMRTALPALGIVHKDFMELTPYLATERALPDATDIASPFSWRELEFDAVGFSHPGRSEFALQDINLKIAQGEMIGIVGRSGAGKSTLIDLLTGLMPPNAGRITVDGTPLAEIRHRWQTGIGFVPQHVYLLDGTLRENIAFGQQEEAIDDSKVLSAAANTGLSPLIDNLEHGIYTVAGERGAGLSGGQAQRIGLARALYTDPTLLILDEATSALDNETERDIRRFIASCRKHMTIVVIAHRITTVMDCDTLVFLKDGRIAGTGTFSELKETCPDFRLMVEAGEILQSDATSEKEPPRLGA